METTETLGKYIIKQRLSHGAGSSVYLGWDPLLQRQVAIKVITVCDAPTPDVEALMIRLRQQAQAGARLTHHNIVSIYDYAETAGSAYLVMEYVEGPTLEAVLNRYQPLALPEVLRIMQGLLAGLEFSHAQGIVHGHIEPANLILSSEDRSKRITKIMNFGIDRIDSGSPPHTGQMLGKTVDVYTDIWCAGAVLYQLLTGVRRFERGGSAALRTGAQRPSQISVTAPPALDAIVGMAMAKRPSDRFASAAEFSRALQAAMPGTEACAERDFNAMPPERAGAVLSRRPETAHVPKPKAQSLRLVTIGALLIVALVGAGIVFWSHDRRETSQVGEKINPVASASSVSDILAKIISTQRCAFVRSAVHETGETVVTGIAGYGVQDEIRRAAEGLAISGKFQWQVTSVAAVFCPALELLQSVTPPPGAAQPAGTLTLADNRTVLHDGDLIRPRLLMPNFAGYARVDYVAGDGSVQHLYPQVGDANGTPADRDRRLTAGEMLRLGDQLLGQPAWVVGAPYGTDMIIAIVSSELLFAQPRPGNVEPSLTYLHDLDIAMQSRRGSMQVTGYALLVQALPK